MKNKTIFFNENKVAAGEFSDATKYISFPTVIRIMETAGWADFSDCKSKSQALAKLNTCSGTAVSDILRRLRAN